MFYFLSSFSVQDSGWSVSTGTYLRSRVIPLRTTGSRQGKWSVVRQARCCRPIRATAAMVEAAPAPRLPCTAKRRHRPTGKQHPGTTSPSGYIHPMYKKNCKVPIFSGFVRFLFFYRQSLVCFFDDDVDSAWDSLVVGIPSIIIKRAAAQLEHWCARECPRASTFTLHTPVGLPHRPYAW